MICHMAFSFLCFITIVFSFKKKKAKTQADNISMMIDFTHFDVFPYFYILPIFLKLFLEVK